MAIKSVEDSSAEKETPDMKPDLSSYLLFESIVDSPNTFKCV